MTDWQKGWDRDTSPFGGGKEKESLSDMVRRLLGQQKRETHVISPGPSASLFNEASPDVTTIEPMLTISPSADPVEVLGEIGPAETVWGKRGWRRRTEGKESIYEGFYHVDGERFRGMITVKKKVEETWVQDPPPGFKRHPKSICFHKSWRKGNNWWYVHYHHRPETVCDAIVYMERLLWEAINDYS